MVITLEYALALQVGQLQKFDDEAVTAALRGRFGLGIENYIEQRP